MGSEHSDIEPETDNDRVISFANQMHAGGSLHNATVVSSLPTGAKTSLPTQINMSDFRSTMHEL